MRETLLQTAQSRDVKELVRRLELVTQQTHHINCRFFQLSETEKLWDEALWYARRGDINEAIYRLEQAA